MTLLALFLVAVLAGTIDAIAGGGGLLTVPALLLAGFGPVAAIATNKLQGVAGTVAAAIAYARQGAVIWPWVRLAAVAAGAASLLGAAAVGFVPRRVLDAAIPVVLVAIAVLFARDRRLGAAARPALLSRRGFAVPAAAIGFYDGAFGPGAGAFYTASFAGLRGEPLLTAAAHAKVANAARNGASCLFFLWSGATEWRTGLVMALGAALGAEIGARLAVRVGARLIRPVVVTVAVAAALRLVMDPANPWRALIWGG